MVYKPTNITGGPQTVWGCLKIGHPKNLSIIIFPNEIESLESWRCSDKPHVQSHPCTNTPWNLMVLHYVPPFSHHVPQRTLETAQKGPGFSRPGIHREHHGGNGCTGQQQCHWLPPLWVNFITTSRRSPEPWKWWFGYVRIREIIPFYGNYSG